MAKEPAIEFVEGPSPVNDDSFDWVVRYRVEGKSYGVRLSASLMDPNSEGFSDRVDDAARRGLRAAALAGTLGKDAIRVTEADLN